MKIDIQGLLNVCHAAEQQKYFAMNDWANEIPECGTSGCLIGSFCLMYKDDELKLKYKNITRDFIKLIPVYKGYSNFDAAANRFGITKYEAVWLFAFDKYFCSLQKNNNIKSHDLQYVTKEQALARLRKFIYYKLKKNELTWEEGRKVDGNKASIHAMEMVSA